MPERNVLLPSGSAIISQPHGLQFVIEIQLEVELVCSGTRPSPGQCTGCSLVINSSAVLLQTAARRRHSCPRYERQTLLHSKQYPNVVRRRRRWTHQDEEEETSRRLRPV